MNWDWFVTYWAEWLLGIMSTGLTILYGRLSGRIRREHAEQEAVKAGLQALLRAQMVNDYNHYSDKGWAPIYARENFENCWTQYEALGKNGVMSDIHDKFMALPTKG